MAEVVNGKLLVPSFNGTLIDKNECTPAICSMKYAELLYIPSRSANAAYLAIFILFLLVHLGLGFRYRAWGFMTGFVCGLLLEVIGYIGRLMLHNNVFHFGSFAISLVCLTIAPAFLSASIYSCISRLAVVYGPNTARLSPKTYTLLFVCCDIISLILQAAGGGVAASATPGGSGQHNGVNVMIAGLSFQVISLVLFIALSLDLMLTAFQAGTDRDHRFTGIKIRRMFRLFPWVILFASLAIFVRCCFRVAELKNGFDGGLANNQALFMVFEGPAIMLAVLALTVFYPVISFNGRQGWQEADWNWKTGNEDISPWDNGVHFEALKTRANEIA